MPCNDKSKWRWVLGLAAAALLHAMPGRAAEVQGRVVDSAGRPVAGAKIRIWRKATDSANRTENQEVNSGGAADLRTDVEGRFRIESLSDLGKSVCVVAEADETLAARSDWTPSGERDLIDLGDVVARRLRNVTGRVRDRQGTAVRGATVFHSGDGSERAETVTDQDGAFRLDRVPEGRIGLFAERAGCRFTGVFFDPAGNLADLTLIRDDEPIEPLKTLPPVLSIEEEKALARQVLSPYLERVDRADDRSKTMAVFALRSIDESKALERLEAISFEDAEEKDRVRELTIEAMAYRSSAEWDEITTWVESLSTPASKAAFYVFSARAKVDFARPEPQTLLHEALLHARAIDEPKRRALELARIACAQYDLGIAPEAELLAREAFATLDPLPVGHNVPWDTTGTVAMAAARYDLPAARGLLGRLHYDSVYAYEMGRLAYQTAISDAAQAEALWLESGARPAMLEHPLRLRDAQLAAPICYRLAQRNPTIARRVAEGLKEASHRIAALGAVAQALAETDGPAARQLLHEILLELPSAGPASVDAADADWQVVNSRAAACCQLLPLAERIDPQLARECLWRAVALRQTFAADVLDNEAERADLHLIGMLARYDRDLAAALLEPLAARFDEFVASESRNSVLAVIEATASIDPRKAAKLLDRLPPTEDANVRQMSNVIRVLFAWNFGGGDLPRWRWETFGYANPADYESWR